MKTIQRLTQRLVASAIAAAVIGLAHQAVAQGGPTQLTAKVIRLQGDARYSGDGQTWHTVRIGDVLRQGTVIQTGDKSMVDLMLGEGYIPRPSPINFASSSSSGGGGSGLYSPEEKTANVVRVFQSSVLAIDRLTSESSSGGDVEETQLDLRAGQVLGNVKKLSAASKYEIKIPNGVAGIRGTIYLINSSGVVDVLVGSVVIAVVAPDGSVTTRVVSAGNQWDPQTGTIIPIPSAIMDIINANITSLNPQPGPTTTQPNPGGPIIYVSPINKPAAGPAPAPPVVPPPNNED